MNIKDAYRILEVSRFSSDNEISSAYRSLVKRYHPDRNKNNPEAIKRFEEVKEAYDMILKARKNKKNSLFTRINKKKQSEDYQENTENVKEKIPMRGNDVFVDVDISFEEACLGCKKDIMVNRLVKCQCLEDERDTCEFCHGTGKMLKKMGVRLNIPSCVSSGQTIIIRERGNVGDEGAKKGDLMVRIHVQPSDDFRRDGLNIYSKLYVSFPDLALGCVKKIKTIKEVKQINIKPYTEPGSEIVLTAQGLIDKETGEVGNHYVVIYLDMPKSLTEKQINKLKEFKDTFIEQ